MPLAERYAGWILAFCLHVFCFASLLMFQPPEWPTAEPARRTIVVDWSLPEPPPAEAVDYEPAGEDVPPPEQPPNFAAASAAAALPAGDPDASEEAVNEPAAANSNAAPPSRMEPQTDGDLLIGRTAEVAELEEQQLQDLLDRHADVLEALQHRSAEMAAVNREQGAVGSAEIEQRLRLAQVDQTADQTLFRKPILQQGVHREIDISDVTIDQAQTVFDRYGIKIIILDTRGGMPAQPKRGGFLNRVVTDSGVYVRPEGARGGVYQAFSFGPIAEGRMAQIEEQALVRRGLDPSRSRVLRVTFGLVPTPSGYDLGVKFLDAQPLPDDPKHGAAAPAL
jgi:hypothetical protein